MNLIYIITGGNVLSTKLKVCVIFGGASSEHEVSCVSATSVINNLDKDKYLITMDFNINLFTYVV